jgi:hypothetical protein
MPAISLIGGRLRKNPLSGYPLLLHLQIPPLDYGPAFFSKLVPCHFE